MASNIFHSRAPARPRYRLGSALCGLAAGVVPAAVLSAQTLERPGPSEPMLALERVGAAMQCEALLEAEAVFGLDDLVRITAASVVEEAGRPAFCGVAGYIAPQIHFELELPLEAWNQRYLQNGCGGYCGSIGDPGDVSAAAGCGPVENGAFARASTDGGHTAPFNHGMWAVDNPQAQVDLGYRAVHEVAVASKAIIAEFYGQAPRFSYFTGCSDGGREGLMEAQRYPDDFDGIVAGAPANIWSSLNGIFQPWVVGANTREDGRYIITPEKIPALERAAMEACDARDGLEDGIIADPRACDFDPAAIQCPAGADRADCLTEAQVAAARRIYTPPTGPDGRVLYAGAMPVGSEGPWAAAITAPAGQRAISEGYASYRRYLDRDVALDSRLTDWTIDAEELEALRSRMGTIYDATDPDLAAFRDGGGKLVLWHGWADQAIPPEGTIAYFDAVREALGGAAERDAFMRLYMIPGLYHCAGGELDRFDFLTAVMDWVESDATPERITAWTEREGEVTRTRPVYPYPDVARYEGEGNVDDAASFTSAAPAASRDAGYEWAGAFESGYQRVCRWSGDPFRDGEFVCEPAE